MACSVQLSSYSLGECFTSRGGIKAVWVANFVDDAYQMSGDTVNGFASGITWYKQELRRGTGSMTSTYNYDETNGSSFIQTDAIIRYSKMEKESRVQMNALTKGEILVIVADENGEYYALGKESPVVATAGTGQTGTARNDGNYYEITLSDYSSEYPAHLNDTAIAALPA